jgi:putative two-component system response regulator
MGGERNATLKGGRKMDDVEDGKTDYRLLVVDDEPGIRSILKRALAPTFIVDVAASGREALRLFQQEPYDVVLTDLSTMSAHGYEIAKTMKRQASRTVVILVTGNIVTPQDLKVWDVDFLIEKPFEIEYLPGVIVEVLRQRMDR